MAKSARFSPGAWDPSKTWVFTVAVIDDSWPDLPHREADLLELLRQRGVPRGNIVHLKDREATVDRVGRELLALLGRASAGDLLILHFAGHGSEAAGGGADLWVADGAWKSASIFTAIERHFRGAGALLLPECCQSGSVATDAVFRAGRVAYAVLASSLASQQSVGTWAFCDTLIDAFSGKALVDVDADGDGHLTLGELGAYVEQQMALHGPQLSTFLTTNGFDPALRIARNQPLAHRRIGEPVFVRDDEGNTWAGQITGVEAGRYQVRYAGYDAADDTWVSADALSPWAPVRFAAGTRVAAESEEEWYPATVIAERMGFHLVRYEDYDDGNDEWLPPARIRAR